MPLTLEPNIPDPDGFYAELLQTHEGLSEAESHALNARLVLLLANHVGDRQALSEALAEARRTAKSAV
jgi:hypothetical protein